MTDIVERARKEGSGRGELDGTGTDALLLELAAEIERLRDLWTGREDEINSLRLALRDALAAWQEGRDINEREILAALEGK